MDKKDRDRLKEQEFLSLIKNSSRNRLVITTVVLVTFLLIMFGIGLAILGEESSPINQEWKEVLLLVLGAFISSYGKIIDFWFQKNNDFDRNLIDAAEGDDNKKCSECPED
jgi:hypothetical protein